MGRTESVLLGEYRCGSKGRRHPGQRRQLMEAAQEVFTHVLLLGGGKEMER